jgi:hypothetical protein
MPGGTALAEEVEAFAVVAVAAVGAPTGPFAVLLEAAICVSIAAMRFSIAAICTLIARISRRNSAFDSLVFAVESSPAVAEEAASVSTETVASIANTKFRIAM